jgi:N-acetylneuraminic acid mutarotase
MSLCNVQDKLYLFGGSGPHAQCFNDLYTFNPVSSKWTHCNNFTDLKQQPKMRAGHSMTLVGTKLYIIGGSYGQDYLKDVYELDTDPCPDWDFENNSKDRLAIGLAGMFNNKEHSDVCFVV